MRAEPRPAQRDATADRFAGVLAVPAGPEDGLLAGRLERQHMAAVQGDARMGEGTGDLGDGQATWPLLEFEPGHMRESPIQVKNHGFQNHRFHGVYKVPLGSVPQGLQGSVPPGF